MEHLKNFETFVNENYNNVDEGILGDGIKKIGRGINRAATNLFADKPVTREEAIKIINNHPAKRLQYQKLQKAEPDKAELYIEFISKHPEVLYVDWSDKLKNFIDTGSYKAAVGQAEV